MKLVLNPSGRDDRLAHRMLAAAAAGTSSWLAFYPFDVVKSRMQVYAHISVV